MCFIIYDDRLIEELQTKIKELKSEKMQLLELLLNNRNEKNKYIKQMVDIKDAVRNMAEILDIPIEKDEYDEVY